MSSLREALETAFAEPKDETTQPATVEQPTAEVTTEKPVEQKTEVKADKVRDESGKFAKAEKPEADVPAPVRKAPSSWKPAAQEAFLKADRGEALTPEEVRLLTQEAERRESDFHKGVSEFKSHADRAQQYEQAIAPYKGYLEQLKVDAPTAINYLLKTEHTLRTADPLTKMQTFQRLAQDYGIDLGQIQQMPQQDPQTQYLMQQLQELRNQQMMWQNQAQQQEQMRAQQELQSFSSADKPHFEAVRNDMADLLETGKATSLEQAYEMAVWMRPDIRQSLLDQQRAEAQRKALEEAQARKAKAAAVSVKGSGAMSGVQPVKGSLRDMIAAQFEGN